MHEIQRQELLLDILQEQRFVTVAELTQRLRTSEGTIRRDLVKLDKQKKLVKVHGGAQVVSTETLPPKIAPSNERSLAGLPEPKLNAGQSIAHKAIELCHEGESIIINGGSLTSMMGEMLRTRNLNILTNSFELAHDLVLNSENQISLPGGEVYRKQGIILSAYDNDTTQNYSATKMFMEASAISEVGVTESDSVYIRSEQKLRRQADKLIVLAESSKLGNRCSFIFCPLSDVDTLITDSAADKRLLDAFKKQGVKVIIADLDD